VALVGFRGGDGHVTRPLRVLANVQQATIKPVITAAVALGTLVHTDEYSIYARLLALRRSHNLLAAVTTL